MAKKQFSKRPPRKAQRLSKKQQSTVSDNLQKRIEQLRTDNALEATVISHMGYNVIVQTAAGAPLLACDWRQNIGAICAGDQVLISEQSTPADNASDSGNTHYRIEAVLPRTSVIEKQNVYRGAKPFAANIDQLLVIITHEPMFQASLLDRYLIMAHEVGVDALIYFNKVDILTDANIIAHVQRLQAIYEAIPNVRWVSGSLKTADGLDDLQAQLDNRKTVITGQSGVGKSTLINALIPDIDVQTMSISEASGLGRHSTTNSTLYRLNADTMHAGILIDTPGVRSFDTYHLSPEAIQNGFADIAPLIGHCRFSDCSHTHEAGCAIKQAVSTGEISQLRYDSFLQTLTESQRHDR
ncbi:MAG: ribosome small subunit-dependent GTPase A [Gammaproteobacteria bacterium]|nr:MAG: ribosome small subunit-dependent GTPase A [Gammaproteobacteria bacterium]